MYNPSWFVEERVEVLHSLIRSHPFATLVTCGAGGPDASHIPMVLHADDGLAGVLRCHLARANSHWKAFEGSPAALAIFQGAEHYITPSWYPSRREHEKVVPTWNYVAVHVRGRAKLFDEPDELISHLRALTDQSERGSETPWSVDDAPGDYIAALSKAIVGIEIVIDKIEGKWKASQNRPEADQRGVIAGLDALGTPSSTAMARVVEQRNRK